MRRIVLLVLAVAGCANPPPQKVVEAGQLFCATSTATGPLVVALADAAGAPVLATNATAAFVQAACAQINAIPVTPPPVPAAAPVVAVPVAKP